MVGHLKVSPCKLAAPQKASYWLSYCSLCDVLRKNQGLPVALLLSNELMLLLLAFDDYIPKNGAKTACPAKLFLQKNPIYQHEVSKLAASLSILLAWIKVTDDLTDEPNLSKKLIFNILDKKMRNNMALSENLQNVVADYILIVKANETDFEKVQSQSNNLAWALATEIGRQTTASPDFVAQQAETFGLLGELVGIADHLVDFKTDLYQSQYNPIIQKSENEQVTFAIAYQYFLDKFHYKRNLILLRLKETQNPTFVQATQVAMQTVLSKIQANKPAFVEYAPANEVYQAQKMQIQRADCDCCVCDCVCEGCCEGCCDKCCGSCNKCCGCDKCCNKFFCCEEYEDYTKKDKKKNRRRFINCFTPFQA